jgi:hypothetical protein
LDAPNLKFAHSVFRREGGVSLRLRGFFDHVPHHIGCSVCRLAFFSEGLRTASVEVDGSRGVAHFCGPHRVFRFCENLPPGVVLLYGEPFKQGADIQGASVYDILPTLAYLSRK